MATPPPDRDRARKPTSASSTDASSADAAGLKAETGDRRARLGELAVEQGFLTAQELQALLARTRGGPRIATGELLIRERYLTLDGLTELLDEQKRRRNLKRRPDLSVGPGGATLDQLLARATAARAHELVLLVGRPPAVRAPDVLVPLPEPALDVAGLEALIAQVFSAEERAAARRATTLKTYVAPSGRYRATLGASLQGPSLSLRRLGLKPDEDGLVLPETVAPLANLRRGLVIVAGVRAVFRASVLAKLVDQAVRNGPRHVIAIDRESRYEHVHHRGLVAERVVGEHTRSYEQGLRATLREDPDVLAIGELRGAEAVATALLSAETGHLVLCSFHAATPAQALRRMVDIQGPSRRALVRATLAGALQAVVIVDAVAGKTGTRHLVADVLPGTTAVARTIREDLLHQLPLPQTQPGGSSRDHQVRALLRAGEITRAAALEAAADPANLDEAPGAPPTGRRTPGGAR